MGLFVSVKKAPLLDIQLTFFSLCLAQSFNYRSNSSYFQKLDSLFCIEVFPFINSSLSNETEVVFACYKRIDSFSLMLQTITSGKSFWCRFSVGVSLLLSFLLHCLSSDILSLFKT